MDCDRVLADTPDSMLDRTGWSVLGGLGNRDVLEPDCTAHDDYRIAYHRDHIAAMGRAVDQGANVLCYLLVQLYPGPTRGLNAGSVLAARLGGKPRASDRDVRPSPPVI